MEGPARPAVLRLGYLALLAYAWSAVSVEVLSLAASINRWTLLLCWVLFLVPAALHLRWFPIRASAGSFWCARATWRGTSGVLLITAAIALVCTLVTALVAAPNNWDSMVYHLARVAQWASRGSVDFYHTGISRQLSQPPAGEYAILHGYVLTGGDRLANLVQWTAGLFALLGLRELGAGFWPGAWSEGLRRRAGAWTVFAAACLPMFLLQQSSTQNDLILGAVLIWSAVAALRHVQHRRRGDAALAMLGMAMAWWTKGTALLLVPPLLGLWLLALAGQEWMGRDAEASLGRKMMGLWRPLLLAVLAVLSVAALNAPHAYRNAGTYGSILGPDYQLANAKYGLGVGLGNSARNAAWLLRTPSKAANRLLHDATGAFHGLMGRDLHDPDATWPWTPAFDVVAFGDREHLMQEDYAPAPVFFLLLIAASLAIWTNRSKTWCRPMQGYTLAWWLLFFGFGLALRWQVWHMRLMLPLLLLGAVPIGAWLARLPRIPGAALGLVLLTSAAPYWWANYSRPWFGAQSIFTTPRSSQYFATWPELEAPYRERAALMVRTRSNNTIPALLLSADAWEYPLWVLAKPNLLPSVPVDARKDHRMEWPYYSAEHGKLYPDPVLIWVDSWTALDRFERMKKVYVQTMPPGEGIPAVYRIEVDIEDAQP